MANPFRLGALVCVSLVILCAFGGPTSAEPIKYKGAVVLDTGVTTQGDVPVSSTTPLPATLAAGSALIGTVAIDQTTPGTTNKVSIGTDGTVAINAALPAGSAIVGKVGIDQTTPGTTNKVSIGTDGTVAIGTALPAGSALIGKTGIDQTTPGTTNGVVVNSSALPTGASTATNQTATQAPVTAATATATTSVLAGCRYVSTLDTFTTSQQGAITCGSRGSLHTELWGSDGATPAVVASFGASGVSGSGAGVRAFAGIYLYNGSTLDPAFTCTNTASVNVTAGSTTQIVALSGTTIVRVCSVSLGISATGTAAVVTGTGSNCGTPTAIMTAIPLNTGELWQQTAAMGSSLFRSTSGGEICVTAATGNVTGFITYAQY